MRTIQRAGPNPGDRWLADFLGQLLRDNFAPAAVRGYRYDLHQFLRWFNPGRGRASKNCRPSTSSWKSVNVEGLRPATVSRRLEALRPLCRGAQQSKALKAKVALDLRPVGIARNIYPVGLTEPKVHTLAPPRRRENETANARQAR